MLGNLTPIIEDEEKGIPQTSWMYHVLKNMPLIDLSGRSIPRDVFVSSGIGRPTTKTKVVVLDIGNDAAKTGSLDDESRFQYVRIPTSYKPASKVSHGEGVTEWHVKGDGKESYWIGDDAVSGGDSLPIGPTYQRLADARYMRFLKAALVEALIVGKNESGTYTLALGIGVRNEEIEEINGVQQANTATKMALSELRGVYEIERKDSSGETAYWKINVTHIFPAAQTLGSFFAWYYNLQGKPSQSEIQQLSILDYGGGDTHLLNVKQVAGKDGKKKLTITGERLGDGTVEIAKGLIVSVKQEYDIIMTVAEAQQALMRGAITKGGRETSIDHLINELKRSRVENVLGRTLNTLQSANSFLFHSGGGASLMHEEIKSRMALTNRQDNEFLIVPPVLASPLNAVGLYAFAYYRLMAMAHSPH